MNLPNQAYQLFIEEAPELLREIETGLLNLQEDKSITKIHGIMRATHSLKFAAASTGLQTIKDIVSQLEEYFQALYNQDLVVDTELENLFLEAYDCLAIPLKQQLETNNFDSQEAQTKIAAVTQKLAIKLENALEDVKNYIPSAEDLGIDLVQSLFKVDIVYEICRLKGLIISPQTFNVEQELEESLSILKDLSEATDLAGFSMLINITQQAFANHPDKAVAIAGLLLNDLQNSRDLVLSGDRTEAINPCSSLFDLAEDIDTKLDDNVIQRIIRNQKSTLTVEDPVYQFFIAEIPDLLNSLEAGLLRVKQDKSTNNVNDIMRAAHSIKGGAASIGLDGIKNIAHKLEDYIKALFDDSVIVDDELETDLLEGFDCLQNALTEQMKYGNYSLHWLNKAETVWQKLEQKLGEIDKDYLPSSADLGIDLVKSLFEVDIADSLQELQESLDSLPSSELLPTVNQQLEIIAGFAQICASLELAKIVTAGTQALFHHPEEVVQITSLLIKDITKIQEQVLSGEKTISEAISPELLTLAQMSADDWKLEESLMGLMSADDQTIDDEQALRFSQIPEFSDLVDSEIFDSGDNSGIFESANFDNELISFPESDLFTQNQVSEDLTPKDLFVDNSGAEINQMDSQQQLQAQSYQFFIEEAVDLIAVIDNNLEKVLANRNLNDINEVARCAHSLKGGSRSAGLEDLGMIALRVEKSLKALFNENIPLTESLKSYLREIYQLLRQAVVARIENQEFDETSAANTANEMWAEFEAEYGEEIAKAEEFLPSSADLGIDIATSIFEIDVLEGINNLQQVLNEGSETELEETLTMQIDVFSGFGEMLNLPGFISISQTTTEAFANNPQQLSLITQTFIDNLQTAREQVLQGDRTTGGEPSLELLNLAKKIDSVSVSEVPMQLEESVDITDTAYSFFIEEVPELLQIIENGLLNLREEERETAKIHEIMRAAHSLKGGAATVGLETIKTISHQLEDVFKVLYDPAIEVDTELESWLLDSFDCLSHGLNEQIETGSYDAQAILAKANEAWIKINNKLGDALSRADDYIPSSSDLGIDMVQSIFDVDVAQELARLKSVSTEPITEPLTGELRATLEVFSGFGEMLNLSGFLEIAQLGLQAVEQNPDNLVSLTKIIINDVEKARDSILKGDRTTGGEPSPELIRYAESQGNSAPSLDDVFGEQIAQVEEIFELSSEDSENEGNAPSLEEVFPMDIDALPTEKALTNNIDSDQSISELENVFASELLPEEIELLSKASELELEEEQKQSVPSLEEVFQTPEIEDIIIEEEDNSSIDSPKLEDVFDSELGEELFVEDNLSENSSLNSSSIEQQTTIIEQPQEQLDNISSENNDQFEEVFTEENISENNSLNSSLIEQQTTIIEQPQEQLDNISSENKDQSHDRAPNNLADVVQSISNIYQTLPGLKPDVDFKVTAQPIKKTSTDKTKTVPAVAKTNLTIRVDLDRLERMNNLIGELSINRNGLSLQNDKLQNSVQELLGRFANFQQIANNLRDLSDKMLVSPETFASVQNQSNKLESSLSDDELFNLNSAFDALEMDRYDNLYNVVQGLIEEMIQLEEAVDDIALFASQSGETVENQRQMLNRLRDELMWARMLPLGEILNRFPRILRDLSVKYNKKVNLKIEGNSVLVDKAALEKLYDPLVHLIRNAFDHGIETPEIRRQRGKSTMGTIHVKAYHQGNQTIIEIRDDGGGLNLNRIGEKAIERHLLTVEQLAVISKDNLLDLIFEPGFSTAAEVTEISGRGVGLDIVRSQLRALKGNICVNSDAGVGTTFILSLPLTLTIDKLLVLSTGPHFYALPSDNIAEIIVPEDKQIKTSANQRFLHYENKVIPVYSLTHLLEYRCYVSEGSSVNPILEIIPTPEEWGNPLLILNLGKEFFAIEVEHLVSEQELVIKPFGKSLTAPSYTYGCTILGDGTLIPVINTSTLLTNFLQLQTSGKGPISAHSVRNISQSESKSKPRLQAVNSVLVVDDSAAMRKTLALSLEKAGYRVLQAKDGKDALEQLQQLNNISLIICDIEMPNMNGFEFLGQRRRYPELNKIPVAMLTSRSSDKHRKLAIHLGANAYFTKPYIEQKFLQSIQNLIEQKSLAGVSK